MEEKKSPKVSRFKPKRDQADEVFIATATEPLRKKKAKTPLHLTQAQRDSKIAKAEEIVRKAQEKRDKGKGTRKEKG